MHQAYDRNYLQKVGSNWKAVCAPNSNRPEWNRDTTGIAKLKEGFTISDLCKVKDMNGVWGLRAEQVNTGQNLSGQRRI